MAFINLFILIYTRYSSYTLESPLRASLYLLAICDAIPANITNLHCQGNMIT